MRFLDSIHGQRNQHSLSPIVLILLLWGLAGCSDQAPPASDQAKQAPMPVSVVKAEPTSVPTTIEVVAQVEGAKEADVRARVSGVLEQQLYSEGQPVKAGQALFQLERTQYEIALQRAQAAADQASREVKRLKQLLKQKAVSRQSYDNALSTEAMALADLRQAQLNLSWTTVTAPIDGFSGRALKSAGNLIEPGNLLTSIDQLDPIWVRFSIPQSEFEKFPQGHIQREAVSGVELILADGRPYGEQGQINFIAQAIDREQGTQQVRASFANPKAQILPGQFMRARLLLPERTGVYLVPQTAVMQTAEGHLVMLANADNKVTPRPVKAAEWQGTQWVITEGLTPGDRIITDNLIKLRPGMPVSPKDATSAAIARAD